MLLIELLYTISVTEKQEDGKWTGHKTKVADMGEIYVGRDAGAEKYGILLYSHAVS